MSRLRKCKHVRKGAHQFAKWNAKRDVVVVCESCDHRMLTDGAFFAKMEKGGSSDGFLWFAMVMIVLAVALYFSR